MVFNGEIIVGKNPECPESAEREGNMFIHPSRPEKRRVEPVFVVRCENEQPLASAARPQPVCEVKKPREGNFAALLVRPWPACVEVNYFALFSSA